MISRVVSFTVFLHKLHNINHKLLGVIFLGAV